MTYFRFPKVASKSNEQIIIKVEENGVVCSIPESESNTDYQQYLAWLAEGNTPEPWQPET
jgi:hypothetical protein